MDRATQVILRFLHINDVYELENLPRFATAVRETKAAARMEEEASKGRLIIKVLAVVAGDFLAPSLLSCLDNGRGMVDVLNACGVDYVCLGNHETDIPHRDMLERIVESDFVWINSSIPSLPLLDVPLEPRKIPEYALLEVGGIEVALLGLLTEDPGLYRPRSFADSPILPLLPTAAKLREKLYRTGGRGGEGVDCVLAMTHQSIAADRELAQIRLFPLILGGHDHDPFLETYGEGGREGGKEGSPGGGCSSRIPSAASLQEWGGERERVEGEKEVSERCTLVKVGMDATWIGVVDVAFGAEESGAEGGAQGGREDGGDAGNGERRRRRRPEVKACIKEAASFAVDPAVQERVEVHWRVLEELERAVLCPLPTQTPLSSKGVRKMQTSVGTMLLTAARQALQVDCVFVNGGNIRAGVAYPLSQKVFTYKDLKAEIPFPCEMVTVRLPGSVLSSLLQYSRQFALLDPPVEKGGFLQVDDGVRVDASTHAITHVQGRPLEASRMYSLATTWGVVSGIDDLRPILDYQEAHPEAVFPTSAEAGRGLKEVLVAHHSRMLWWDLAKHVGFRAMDTDGDGVLSQKEVAAATQACYGEALSRLVVANLMATADFDGDGVVSVKEFIRICLSQEAAFQDGDTDNDERLSFEEVWSLLKAHYDGKSNGSHTPIRAAGEGKGLTEADVREMYDEIDSDKMGGISWAEFREHMARQREPTALVI